MDQPIVDGMLELEKRTPGARLMKVIFLYIIFSSYIIY